MQEYKNFVSHFEEMLSLFDEYRVLLKEKEQSLIDGDYAYLEEIIAKEEPLMMKIDECEKKRDDLSKVLCAVLKIDEKSSVTEISKTLGEEKGVLLMTKAASLMEILQDISIIHYSVDKMIYFQLKYSRILESTVSGQGKINTYKPSGSFTKKKGPGFFEGNG